MSETSDIPTSTLTESDAQRFWDKVERGTDDACWRWLGGFFTTGYPYFWLRGSGVGGHRVMCALHHGLARDRMALHSCDNPGCVNPAHLRRGNHADNMGDRTQRGHYAQGARHHNTSLTDDDVLEMRRIYDAGEMGTPRLARRFGIAQDTAYKIVKRQTWRHLS